MAHTPPTTLADKIDWLFTTIRHPAGHEYTYQEVEEGTGKLGHPVTGAYVWKLRKGKADKPNWLILRALAQFFKVPISFFYDDDLTPAKLHQVEVEAALQQTKVAEIALRAGRLDEEGRNAVLTMINHIMKIQQTAPLPDSPTHQADKPPEGSEG